MKMVVAALLAVAMSLPGAWAADRLRICHGSVAAALVPLAKEQSYFAEQGLDVETVPMPSGFQALQSMLDGECALSTAAVPPIAYQSQRRSDFRVLAAISSSGDYDRIIVRRTDDGRDAADLRGRRIAVAKGTSAHYFLDTYLAAHGIAPDDVTRVFLPVEEVAGAFRRSEVDAAAHWEPHILDLATELGDRASMLTAPGLVVSPFLLLAREDYVHDHTARIESVLRALVKAEQFARTHAAESRSLIADYFSVDDAKLGYTWDLQDYRVALHQPVLIILDSVARWQIRQLPAAERPPLPNYLEFLSVGPLRAVMPDAVTVID